MSTNKKMWIRILLVILIAFDLMAGCMIGLTCSGVVTFNASVIAVASSIFSGIMGVAIGCLVG